MNHSQAPSIFADGLASRLGAQQASDTIAAAAAVRRLACVPACPPACLPAHFLLDCGLSGRPAYRGASLFASLHVSGPSALAWGSLQAACKRISAKTMLIWNGLSPLSFCWASEVLAGSV
jgi:hypothetical protein